MQRRTQPKDSVVEWSEKGDSVDNKDILLFLTVGEFLCILPLVNPTNILCSLGVNHVPRPEDWPV
jgi:Cu2+-containing amine oxidase